MCPWGRSQSYWFKIIVECGQQENEASAHEKHSTHFEKEAQEERKFEEQKPKLVLISTV